MNKENKILTSPLKMIIIAAVISIAVAIANIGVFAISDGAYTTGASASYAHPHTGKIIDAGNNPSLGDGMVKGIVEKTALVERVGGRTYVTVGIGLSSAVSDFKVYTERGGSYTARAVTKTGSFGKDGDTVTQYRFEVSSLDDIIAPEMYVGPMGRNVKYFIKINSSGLSPGTGAYNALLAQKTSSAQSSSPSDSGSSTSGQSSSKDTTSKDSKDTEIDDKESTTDDETTEESEDKEKEKDSKKSKESKKSGIRLWLVIGLSTVIIAGIAAYIFIRRRK